MKQNINSLFFFILFIGFTEAQVGIGNTEPKASLDISASSTTNPAANDGILIPRMSNFPSSPGADQDGMLIFYTGTEQDGKGFYYWNNTNSAWTSFSAVDNDWAVIGSNIERQNGDVYIGDDADTDNDLYTSNRIIDWDDTDYYLDPNSSSIISRLALDDGTTAQPSLFLNSDTTFGFFHNTTSQALSIVNNGSEVFAFQKNGVIRPFGAIKIGENSGGNSSNSSNIFIGFNSGNSDTFGTNNIAIGGSALSSTSGGFNNIALGISALRDLGFSIGGKNIAIGNNSLSSLDSGNDNIAIGDSALTSIADDEENNLAIGNNALLNSTNVERTISIGNRSGLSANGNNNVYIGFESGRINNGNGNIFIGYQSGATENSASNKLFISNNGTSNPLIYGEFNTGTVRINNRLEVRNPSSGGYRLPLSDGNANQVITTDGNGNLSFTDASSSSQMALCKARASGTQDADWDKLNFVTEEFDVSNNFNTASDTFTAPSSAHYRINANIKILSNTNNRTYGLGIYINGVRRQVKFVSGSGQTNFNINLDTILFVGQSQTIEIYSFGQPGAFGTGGPVNLDSNNTYNYTEIQQLN